MLTQSDRKWWAPVDDVTGYLQRQIPRGAKVLDVGPGHAPFPRSDVCVDFQNSPGVPPHKMVKCDLASEPLPFPDKSFDFVYCRHVLEDMFDPFPLCREMARVGKAGYIETPSPMAELTRGVDGGSPAYCGYHHHRWVIWATTDGELRFVSKYPLIEYLPSPQFDHAGFLRNGPKYWNTYYLWRDEIRTKHLQNVLDFMLPNDYPPVLKKAANQSFDATDRFWPALQQEASHVA